ncbi:MAG: cell division protein FtsL [Burkholderiales bacterium]
MARLNLLLLAVAIACALATVAAHHQSRKLFVALEKERSRAKQLDIEFGQLQLEASTWGMQSRIEQVASAQLNMRALGPDRLQMLVPGEQVAAK